MIALSYKVIKFIIINKKRYDNLKNKFKKSAILYVYYNK